MSAEENGPPGPRKVDRWLWVLVLSFAGLLFLLSTLRYLEFATGDWDLGTMQQALYSTAHGHPLYEADDYEQSGALSLFQIHPSFVALALVPLYEALPSGLTLLGLQSFIVALAAVPLYYLAKDVSGSERKALLAAAVFLVFPAVMSASLADYHLESFLPLEIFSLVLFWRRGWYWRGVVASILAFVTIELGPILVASVAVFFLLPDPWPSWAEARQRVVGALRGVVSSSAWGKPISTLKRWMSPRVRLPSLFLLVVSGIAYLSLRTVEQYPALVFLAPVPVSGNPAVVETSGGLYLGFSFLQEALAQKVEYWLLLYALLAFLPLRALRTQVLALPWVVYTLFSLPTFTVLGRQYGFIPAIPLMVGFVYALADLELPTGWAWLRIRGSQTSATIERAAGGTAPPRPRPRRFDLWARAGPALGIVLLAILVVCLVVSPLDPLFQTTQQGTGYQVSYVAPRGFAQVEDLVSKVPAGAVVLASDDLFPLVANDLHAYTLFPTLSALNNLPFNASHLPGYVLLSGDEEGAVPGWLVPLLSNSSEYALLGEVVHAPKGGVFLYETATTASSVGRASLTVL